MFNNTSDHENGARVGTLPPEEPNPTTKQPKTTPRPVLPLHNSPGVACNDQPNDTRLQESSKPEDGDVDVDKIALNAAATKGGVILLLYALAILSAVFESKFHFLLILVAFGVNIYTTVDLTHKLMARDWDEMKGEYITYVQLVALYSSLVGIVTVVIHCGPSC